VSKLPAADGADDAESEEVDPPTAPPVTMPFEHGPIEIDAARRRAAEAVW